MLSPRMVRIIADLIGDWEYLDERIERVTDEIKGLAHADVSCGQLMTVPGIGPIVASAMVAAIGNGAASTKGRDFAAWRCGHRGCGDAGRPEPCRRVEQDFRDRVTKIQLAECISQVPSTS